MPSVACNVATNVPPCVHVMSGAAIESSVNEQNGLSTDQSRVGVASGSVNDPLSVTGVLTPVETSPPASTERFDGPDCTWIERITSAGMAHVALAESAPLLSDSCVVNEVSIRSIWPDAGAVALMEIVGVVRLTLAGSPGFPARTGPTWPNFIWFGAGLVTCSTVVSGFACA